MCKRHLSKFGAWKRSGSHPARPRPYLAPLQAAAAVVTAKQRPEHRIGRRARIRTSWDLLPEITPEFAEYSKTPQSR
ncbi:SAV_6107 family HEPN domain-containing protein [Streptomyces sp. NBC_01320]|uniref:SAV_6107 family HEPN domain-containing protein n=1 Tax=Streptomyces sp. NBC_01320 TaxID=2903824 RepID=UPI003FA3BE9C